MHFLEVNIREICISKYIKLKIYEAGLPLFIELSLRTHRNSLHAYSVKTLFKMLHLDEMVLRTG